MMFLPFSNDATPSSDVVLDTSSRPVLHDGSNRPEQQHGSGCADTDRDEPFFSVGHFKSDGRDKDIGTKRPEGADGMLSPVKQSEAAMPPRDTLIEDANADMGLRVAADVANNLATASTPSSPSSPLTMQYAHGGISAVLVLNLKDTHLATLLMTTLRACGAMEIFRDFFVIVPTEEISEIEAILRHSIVDNSSNGKLFRAIIEPLLLQYTTTSAALCVTVIDTR